MTVTGHWPRYRFVFDMNAYRRAGCFTLLKHCDSLQAQIDPPAVGEQILIVDHDADGAGIGVVTEVTERGVRFAMNLDTWGDAPVDHNIVWRPS